MRWQGRRASANVEDRRGRSPMVTRGVPVGCGGLLLIGLLTFLMGGDPLQLFEVLEQGGGTGPAGQIDDSDAPQGAPGDQLGQFASVVLADTEDTWNQLFAARGDDYREPTLVLFSGAVQSACGFNSAAVGPFYCPADGRVYIDLSFFDELARRFEEALEQASSEPVTRPARDFDLD